MTGAKGTPAYMAPEQCLADPNLDGKADVYALGIMLYEMLSDRLPFNAEHSFDYMVAHVRGTPRPLNEVAPQVPPEVVDLCHGMLAKSPAERPSMETVVALLEQLRAATAALWVVPRISGPHPQLSRDGLATGETQLGGAASPARQSRESLALGATVAGRATPSARLSQDALARASQAAEEGPAARSARASASLSLLAEPPPAPAPPPERGTPPVAPVPERAGPSRLLWLGGLAAGLLVLGGAVLATGRLRAAPVAPPVVVSPTPAAAGPAPRLVRWTVLSVPLGAEIVRGDGQLLGTTPLELERPPGSGETLLTLRYPGFRDKAMVLSHSTDVKTEVRLEALPSAAPPVPAGPEPESATAKRRKTRVRSGAPKAAGNDVQLLLD